MSTIVNNEGFSIEDIKKITDMAAHVKSLEKKLLGYEPVLDYANEAIEVVDEEGRILYLNKKWSELTGVTREERLGKNIYDINPGGVLVKVLSERKPIFDTITTTPGPKGHHGLSNVFPLFQDEELIGAVLIGKDYSQAVQLSQKLDERETYLQETYKRTSNYSFLDIISNNPKMRDIIALSRQAATTDNPVVLVGEIGTGRDLFAQAIHSGSPRTNKPFFQINCARSSEEKVNYELFGYEKIYFLKQ